jgi:hypothetical protein
VFRDAKLRISERKAKKRRKILCFAIPSGSKFDEVKVTNKRAKSKEKKENSLLCWLEIKHRRCDRPQTGVKPPEQGEQQNKTLKG